MGRVRERPTFTDHRLRHLERRRRTHKDAADDAAWLAEKVRVGAMPLEQLALLAYLDHPPALAALGRVSRPTDLVTWVRGLAPWGPTVVVRAAAAAARRALSSVPAPTWSEMHGLPSSEVSARRILDHAEEWLACPCPPHSRLAADWVQPRWPSRRRTRTAILCDWAAALAGEAGGHVVDVEPRRNRIRSPALVDAARSRLLDWVLEGRETFDRALWLPGDGRGMRPLLECQPVDWRCQECGAFVVRTIEVFPHETNGDSDCLDHPERRCSAGYSTTMLATCSVCGEDLLWGTTYCAHFAASVVTPDRA